MALEIGLTFLSGYFRGSLMKKLGLYSLIALTTICAQAMERSSKLPVYFKLQSFSYPALHNKMATIYVEEDTSLMDAVERLKGKMNIPAESKLLLEFQAQPLAPSRIPNITIIRQDDDVRLLDDNNPILDVNSVQKPI